MSLPEDQRRLIGAFLRRRREQLRAADVGLTASRSARRRTPGLRREEIAEICGMPGPWHAGSGRGRAFPAPAPPLARPAQAMQLPPAGRAYLFQLPRKRDPADPASHADEAEGAPSPALRAALDAMI